MGKKKNRVQELSLCFSIRIAALHSCLRQNSREYIISDQLFKSATSIGANIEEAQGAQSRADFISKLSISYKEARETSYWLIVLGSKSIIPEEELMSFKLNADELCKLLFSIIRTTKRTISD